MIKLRINKQAPLLAHITQVITTAARSKRLPRKTKSFYQVRITAVTLEPLGEVKQLSMMKRMNLTFKMSKSKLLITVPFTASSFSSGVKSRLTSTIKFSHTRGC